MNFNFDDLFKNRVYLKYFIVAFAAFLFFLYLYFLFFGSDRSYIRLVDLNNNYKELQRQVETLKKDNALLQKKYFELKELEGPDE
jgi:sensor histidine kinase YesM